MSYVISNTFSKPSPDILYVDITWDRAVRRPAKPAEPRETWQPPGLPPSWSFPLATISGDPVALAPLSRSLLACSHATHCLWLRSLATIWLWLHFLAAFWPSTMIVSRSQPHICGSCFIFYLQIFCCHTSSIYVSIALGLSSYIWKKCWIIKEDPMYYMTLRVTSFESFTRV